jgi:hypothetical protein
MLPKLAHGRGATPKHRVRFTGGQVSPDIFDQGLEFKRGVGGEGALTRHQQHRDSENGGKFIFHGLDLEWASFSQNTVARSPQVKSNGGGHKLDFPGLRPRQVPPYFPKRLAMRRSVCARRSRLALHML